MTTCMRRGGREGDAPEEMSLEPFSATFSSVPEHTNMDGSHQSSWLTPWYTHVFSHSKYHARMPPDGHTHTDVCKTLLSHSVSSALAADAAAVELKGDGTCSRVLATRETADGSADPVGCERWIFCSGRGYAL